MCTPAHPAPDSSFRGPPIRPELDPHFSAAALWNRAYRARVASSGSGAEVGIALLRPDGTGSVFRTRILSPADEAHRTLTLRYVERTLKFLLWQRGGNRVLISGADSLVPDLAATYSARGARRFDHHFFSEQVFGEALAIVPCPPGELPKVAERSVPLGRHLDGCRIGFDLGGSDRKCAAVLDGEVVFSEEVEWNPYFESDPDYHVEGIHDSLRRAAAHLPRVDAIGGSAAGVYVNNEVRVASLFRGVSPADFDARIRRIFFDLRARWGGVPFEVVNDGEVTALAGSMSLGENAVLGLAMGTSEAVGYVTPDGNITPWLNELAFAPVDYRHDAPRDEWSGDLGCGVQYFSQQAVARLAPAAGLDHPADMLLPERLKDVQEAMAAGDDRAVRIYSTIGTYLGFSLAHYADFYQLRNLLLLGRVTTGEGGAVIIQQANRVLRQVFPEQAEKIHIRTPNEKDKRLGQAVAAASLPMLGT
jgi:predicted NBD/HSP70 family sugar kinase